MSILVTYASKYGATRGIAERIAEKLIASGQQAEVLPVKTVTDLAAYDAFVIGSAAYVGSWLKEAAEFVRRNQAILAAKPVWLFSSGPLGTATKDAKGRDVLVTTEPREFAEFANSIKPRGQRVFYGALDSSKLRGAHRLFNMIPASSKLLIQGDARDWKAIENWAESIAHELMPVTAGVG
jgi:menaquinone-dependent protoporphyrinogen oxidase